jgi:tripartite-type tricarboxylate transporter receptor subunit TctC
MKKSILILCLVGLLAAAQTVSAQAADYPKEPIELIVAYSAGGGTDTGARMLTKVATKYIPQPLVVVNKPGAGGEIGFTALAKAKPDGYTIGFINPPSTVLLPLMRKTGYQMSDFKCIINIVLDPGLLAVRADSPFKTLDDFIKAAKAKPGTLSISNAGVGSDAHMSIIDFAEKAGIKVNPVPFKGAAPARTAALGGHVDAVVMKVGETKTYVQSKQARVLAVMSEKRVKDFPDVPTFKEKGLNVIMAASRGIAGPKAMPDSVAKYLHDKLKKTIEDPEFIAMMNKTGIGISYMGPGEYKKFCDQLVITYGPLWKKAK